VNVDPYTEAVYAAIGDGPGRQRLVRSTDAGETWEIIRSEDCLSQPVSVVFFPGLRFFGSDCGDDVNRIYSTTDDETFEVELLLTGDRDAYVWDMSSNADGWMYAGTAAKLPGGSRAALYGASGPGRAWEPVKEFGVLPEWCGVRDLSRFDSEGWAYCAYTTTPGSFSAFRFRRATSGVDDGSVADNAPGIEVHITPNPTRGQASFWITTRVPCRRLSIRIFDPTGASVRTLESSPHGGTEHRLDWDGRTDCGSPVGSGVYLAEVEVDNRRTAAKLLVMR